MLRKASRHPKDKGKSEVNVVEEKKLLDYSFLKLTSLIELPYEMPRNLKLSRPGIKRRASIVKLNNNSIENLVNMMEHLDNVILRPETLVWIDLSCNLITKIDTVFESFPDLQILLLHGNKIEDILEINNLVKCTKLMKLTLHGNPIETTRNYRFFVLATLPHLKSFDMSTISRLDLITADAFYPNNELKKMILTKLFPCKKK